MSNNTMAINGQLIKRIRISGIIEAKTGLHIGASNIGLAIGGADATVVRNPLTNQPYIPGSSLKGKMRTLTERLEGAFLIKTDHKTKKSTFMPYTEPQNGDFQNERGNILRLFGTMPEKLNNANIQRPPSCLIVRDCPLTKESAVALEKLKTTDMPFTEVKTEVVIDRITSAATPRQLERVPAGAKFKMELIINVYHEDSTQEAAMIATILRGLCLVQNDYLGGKGTRGSGQVEFKITDIASKDKTAYESNSDWASLTGWETTVPTELKDISHDTKTL